jgi:mannose-6-phosphate isomerase-like protein (cupin superfamily)
MKESSMKVSLAEILKKIPGAASSDWPSGEPFAEAMRHGSMSVEVFAPRGRDNQTPHEQDELYFITSGAATFYLEAKSERVRSGDALFVPARARHHFGDISEDFVTWVVFWGPKGGEGETVKHD